VLSADGGSNTLIAGNGTDILTASGGTGNLLEAGSGTDDLASDAGGNTLIGGAGLTQAFYVANSLTVNLAAGSASVNGSGVDDTLINISSVNVVGTGDTLTGGTSAGILWGSGQDDTLIGGGGATTLISTGPVLVQRNRDRPRHGRSDQCRRWWDQRYAYRHHTGRGEWEQ
jgi:Ca2+-binding RTX toxin-like protein